MRHPSKHPSILKTRTGTKNTEKCKKRCEREKEAGDTLILLSHHENIMS